MLLNLASFRQSSWMTLITGELPCFELCEHSILYGHLYEFNHWVSVVTVGSSAEL
jgi:hypothetical protein